MKGLVYGALGLWLLSLGIWAYGEMFIEVGFPEVRGHVGTAKEEINSSDRSDDSALSNMRQLRLEGFARADQAGEAISPLNSRRFTVGTSASSAEEPL